MIEYFFNKIVIFLAVFSVLFLIKEAFLFYRAFKTETKYNGSIKKQIGIATSISYLITLLF